uniref:Uncharacterized protein n=1 Tax=Solanum lycopersicum TaxID=4081 RepID=A0A3Q7FR43_SOLLC
MSFERKARYKAEIGPTFSVEWTRSQLFVWK